MKKMHHHDIWHKEDNQVRNLLLLPRNATIQKWPIFIAVIIMLHHLFYMQHYLIWT